MDVVKGVVLVLRFGLELTALAALAYWGFQNGGSTVVKIVLGLGAPILAAVIWGLFVSPKAAVESQALRIVFEIAVFVAAVLALADAGRTVLAVAFAVVALVDGVLVRVLGAQAPQALN
jgi:Protein of unknown function (DUF2568)